MSQYDLFKPINATDIKEKVQLQTSVLCPQYRKTEGAALCKSKGRDQTSIIGFSFLQDGRREWQPTNFSGLQHGWVKSTGECCCQWTGMKKRSLVPWIMPLTHKLLWIHTQDGNESSQFFDAWIQCNVQRMWGYQQARVTPLKNFQVPSDLEFIFACFPSCSYLDCLDICQITRQSLTSSTYWTNS
jgi:hypothetical protein